MTIPGTLDPHARLYLKVLEARIKVLEDQLNIQAQTMPNPGGVATMIPYFDATVVVTAVGGGISALDDTDGNYYKGNFHNGVWTVSSSLGSTIP